MARNQCTNYSGLMKAGLQKFMHGLFILVLCIEVHTVILAILYCRASLALLSQQIS